jgi:hypothetical protein
VKLGLGLDVWASPRFELPLERVRLAERLGFDSVSAKRADAWISTSPSVRPPASNPAEMSSAYRWALPGV